jgi:hypothetical protein
MLQTRYPILYCVLVLPLTVVRFMGFHEESVTGRSHSRPVANFIFDNLFVLSGVFNALLYRLTRADFFRAEPKTGPPPPPPIRNGPSRTEQGVTTQIDRGHVISSL